MANTTTKKNGRAPRKLIGMMVSPDWHARITATAAEDTRTVSNFLMVLVKKHYAEQEAERSVRPGT